MKFKLPILALGILISISQISQISQAATPPNLNDRIDCKRYIDETFSETVEMLSREDLPPAPNYDLLSKAVEKYYGDSNKIILDDLGYPSIMVRFDSFKDMRKKVHPMFKVDEKFYPCVYIGKYESIVFHDRAYSIPDVDPTTQVDIDDAREFSINKGIGWHLMTNVEYAGLARYCREHDFYPHGNTNTNQSEEFYPGESGRITIEERSDDGKILKNAKFICDSLKLFDEQPVFRETKLLNVVDSSLHLDEDVTLSYEEILYYLSHYMEILEPNLLEFNS